MIGIHIFKIEEEMSVGNLMKFSKWRQVWYFFCH
jgi:hypothetical protein